MTRRYAGAYAVVRDEVPQVFLADDVETLQRVLALNVVAQLTPNDISSENRADLLRQSLLDEQWGDAVEMWIEETGIAVDVYAHTLIIYNSDDRDQLMFEMRIGPLFRTETDRMGDDTR